MSPWNARRIWGDNARMRVLATASLLIAALTLTACGFEAPPAKRTTPPKPPEPPVSTLAATLSVPVRTIVEALNEKTKDEIAHLTNAPVDCLIAKCRLDLIATRSGPITGRAVGALMLTLPFTVRAHLALKSRLFKTGADANAAGEAVAQSRLTLASDWSLKPNTVGEVRLTQGKLRLGPVTTDLANVWDRNAEHLSKPLFKAMDRRIASAVKVKPQAERLWQKAFAPIKVGKSPEAWLVLAPQRIAVGELRAQGGMVEVSLTADTRARVVVGPKPAIPDKLPPLPPASPLAVPSNAFHVAVPAELSYARAAELAIARLEKKPLHVGGTKVRFETLAILPSGDDVVVQARFCVVQGWDPFGWFDSCGTGYLRGRPQFDAAHNRIRITKVHYDLATAGAILSAMKMLAGDELANALQTKLVFDVSRDIGKLHDEIDKALSKPQGRGVQITGHVETFGAPTLTWTATGFLVTFTAEGQIRADLNIAPPKPKPPKK